MNKIISLEDIAKALAEPKYSTKVKNDRTAMIYDYGDKFHFIYRFNRECCSYCVLDKNNVLVNFNSVHFKHRGDVQECFDETICYIESLDNYYNYQDPKAMKGDILILPEPVIRDD